MERAYAKRLVDEFGIHFKTMAFDPDKFIQALEYTKMPESTSFHEIVEDNSQILIEYGRTHTLSLRRILRNNNARDYKLSPLKSHWEALVSKFGIYDSNILTRKLRGDGPLVEIMLESERQGHPYSVLGKFKTDDYEIERNRHTLERPILVIPGISDEERKIVHEWEEENTNKEEDLRTLRFASGLF